MEIVRGQVGTENTWNIAREGGFIAYLRGSIGDLPVRSESIASGDTRALDDSCGRSDNVLFGEGKAGNDVASYAESTVIMNT